ncbi:hypothetical protein M231_04959 [Tremella mesenterica]|uniref:Uncharacterized protein n=1 Tax=Tremella mesenterica TaxID=5217 RepID=A0A4Q1BJC8_TREME|nr:hypothetical protein M231_04959 [Tremella mesenterica]
MPPDSSQSSPESKSKTEKKQRKSWFSLSRNSKEHVRSRSPPKSSPTAPPSQPQERFRPISWKPNRIETLYVSPSERNLYLAAMSQLDQAPPPLPLWSDPAPSLPQVVPQTFDLIPNSLAQQAMKTSDIHPLTTRPMSPKLVTSPEMSLNSPGLMVRDEFRRLPPPRTRQHALLALQLPNGLKFTGFGVTTLIAVDEVLKEGWGLGVGKRSETVENLAQRGENEGHVASWRVSLRGQVWKRKGSEELDSIRLVLAILTVLGVHGWVLVGNLQAASTKKDAHNLLFAYSPEHLIAPPTFFAISFPLPDRVSIISPPPKSTPALISAVRNSIVQSPHSRSGTAGTTSSDMTAGVASTAPSSAIRSRHGSKLKGIKLEGWVHEGVYRFWIDGMRRWLGNGVKRKVFDSLQPQLLTKIVSALAANHYVLAGSIPLYPLSKGRDVLFFSSLPGSGLTFRDTFRFKALDSSPLSSTPGTPVFVSPHQTPPQSVVNPRNVDAENRKLPWQSIITSPREGGSPHGSGQITPPKPISPLTPDQALAEDARRRTESAGSARPLIPNAAQGDTRRRGILLKKNSRNRNRTASGNESKVSSRQPSDSQPIHVGDDRAVEDERWSMVDPPVLVAPDNGDAQPRRSTGPSMEQGRLSPSKGTTDSGESVYLDADNQRVSEDQEPERISELALADRLQLGKPIRPESSQELPALSPKSANRARHAIVDTNGPGVQSVMGSIGVTSTLLGYGGPTPGEQGRMSQHHVDEHGVKRDVINGEVSPPMEGEEVRGKEKEVMRKVWDDSMDMWVNVPEDDPRVQEFRVGSLRSEKTGSGIGNGTLGHGSARTKVIIN